MAGSMAVYGSGNDHHSVVGVRQPTCVCVLIMARGNLAYDVSVN